MQIGIAEATVLSVAFLAIDVAARSLRVVLLLRAFDVRLSFRNACASTLFSDAAAVVTPLRAGGSPARVASLRAAGVSMPSALRALGIDIASYYVVVAAVCAVLGIRMTAALVSADGSLPHPGEVGLPLWAAGSSTLLVVAGIGHLRSPRGLPRWIPRFSMATLSALWWPMLLSLPLGLVSVGARIAVLPIFVLTSPEATEVVDLLLWSAMLTYGQNFVPLPAGAGVVDGALRGGLVAGSGWLGTAYIVWRGLTVGGVAVLGFGIALLVYGRPAVVAIFRRRPAAGGDG